MAARSKPLAAQQRLPMPSLEDKAADLRRSKRPRKLVQQPLPVKQSERRKRRFNILESGATGASRKRARHNPDKAVNSSAEQEEVDNADSQKDPVLYWTKTGHWPKGYSEQSDKNMSYLFARQKSSGSLRRKNSAVVTVDPASTRPISVAPSSITPSDQKPREVKSVPYQDARYEALLATKGSFIGKPAVNKNEARIIRDVLQLIVPSAEVLAVRGAKSLKILAERTRPQPDFSIGFKREAFIKEQLDKLALFISNVISGDQLYFIVTYYIYFPFLTYKVKYSAVVFNIADRQNAYSITLVVRATVELFRLAGREIELYREILAFSVSHDHRSVRIYRHYPVIDGKDTKYYRHPIHEFSFTALDGKEKWTTYKFTKNVYEVWMPSHFKRLCSAVDQIPADLDFSVPQLSQSFGLSEDLQRHNLGGSSQPSSQSRGHSQQSTDDARDTTPNTSFTAQGGSKRRRKRRSNRIQ
ncbi:hypothetical protein CC78DRAFT_556331 [Lojkania enalia]|uniref:DUF7924 domain-containing protein n=1 Tax=Lojkania enalia TaxID=147567 RepID=A0A9P4JXN2_9PLEO|nr:hypothetical protein CC78DRAFT_556331 [Didymosphaeria enalia]